MGEKSANSTNVSTFYRVCTVRHLRDLQAIAVVAVLVMLAGSLMLQEISSQLEPGHLWAGQVGLIGTLATILSWTYQTASNRLGAIDLFGCEISTICRVCLVVDFARFSVRWLENAKKRKVLGGNKKFSSVENYTPVYDKRLSDLQTLDAEVVTYVTEFYTYRKTMLDCLRKIMEETLSHDERIRSLQLMIYMQFLMYESGRKAVGELIDYEPNRAESLSNIYCLELVVYHCLVREYIRDPKLEDFQFIRDRLDLRALSYAVRVKELCERIESPTKKADAHWNRAEKMVRELKSRYSEVFP